MSLFYKLIGAFALVIVLSAAAITWVARVASQNQFRVYTTQSGRLMAGNLIPALVDFYTAHNTWQGVDPVLQLGDVPAVGMGGMMQGMTDGHMLGTGKGTNPTSANMWARMGQRIILADRQGLVVSDSQGDWPGKILDKSTLAQGVAIQVGGRQVGTLIVGSADLTGSGTVAGDFLTSLNRSIFLAIILVATVSLILGSLLFFNLTAPIRQMTTATRSIAGGDFSHRINVRSKDEFGELAQSFNEMADHLARAETLRRQMIADIAHELRNPLAVIQGNLEAMLDGVVPMDSNQVASVHAETILLNRIVEDIRLLSLAEAGQFHLDRKSIQIRDWIDRLIDHWKVPAEEKGIKIEVTVPDQVEPIQADPDRLTQVMNNLITNAFRYTPAGGNISIRVEELGSDRQSLRFSVTDTGPGIAAQDIKHIFERFYQGENGQPRQGKGSGLGLTIVKHIVEAHGGQVHAEAPVFPGNRQESYGTRIWFTLPRNSPLI